MTITQLFHKPTPDKKQTEFEITHASCRCISRACIQKSAGHGGRDSKLKGRSLNLNRLCVSTCNYRGEPTTDKALIVSLIDVLLAPKPRDSRGALPLSIGLFAFLQFLLLHIMIRRSLSLFRFILFILTFLLFRTSRLDRT